MISKLTHHSIQCSVEHIVLLTQFMFLTPLISILKLSFKCLDFYRSRHINTGYLVRSADVNMYIYTSRMFASEGFCTHVL